MTDFIFIVGGADVSKLRDERTRVRLAALTEPLGPHEFLYIQKTGPEMTLPPAAKAMVQAEILVHGHDDVKVIEHPNYGPYVKLACGTCGAETYVRISPGEGGTNESAG